MKTSKTQRDENYVLDLCDKILGISSSRQHRFDFLLGDKNKKGRAVRLPVDAYYKELQLVIEYFERQHTESVIFFDKPTRLTVSGVSRKEQRKIYDQRRQLILSEYEIKIVHFSYSDFKCNRRKRIIKNINYDKSIVKNKLSNFIKIE